jgi:5'-nucleotidase
VISANVDTSREPSLSDLQGFQVLEVAGQRIGIIGTTTEDTSVTSTPGPTVSFRRTEEVLPPIIQRLRADGVRTIILLSHLGLPRDREVAAAVQGLSLIVGGHSHTLLSNRVQGAEGPYPVMVRGPGGGNVPIVQAAAFGRYLGRLQVTLNAEGGVTAASGDVELLGPDVAEDPEIARQLAELAAPLEAIRARVVGESARDIDQSKCRREECEMGNLVSDAVLWRLRGQNVQIVFSNGGGLRAGIGAGPVTFGAVLTVLPFQNTIATFRMKGSDIVACLENGVSQVEQNSGRFPQVGGMRYTWERARPAGSRIVSVEVRGANGQFAPIDPNATYTVATNNFVRQGGDGYSVMRDRAIDPYDYGEPLEDAVAAYIHERTPVTVQIDGRITTR